MGKLYLKKASESDSGFILDLANDPECRKNSFNPEIITLDTHMKWYDKIMNSSTACIYLLMEGDIPVGQGRLELKNGKCRISYSLISARRGCGYGKKLVALLMKRALTDFPDCNLFYAEVMKNNVASQKIFEESMFLKNDVDKETGVFIYVINREAISRIPEPDLVIPENRVGGVLLLSNNRNSFGLYEWLKCNCDNVLFYSGRLSKEQLYYLNPMLTISYNYAYIVKDDAIDLLQGKIINMHISYLPWNKGSDPNFWSFIDDTPKGVTIHLLEKGLDTGRIIAQKECFFDESKETFESTYEQLNYEITELLKSNWEQILEWNFNTYQQIGNGSYHTRKDREDRFPDVNWKDNISKFKKRFN